MLKLLSVAILFPRCPSFETLHFPIMLIYHFACYYVSPICEGIVSLILGPNFATSIDIAWPLTNRTGGISPEITSILTV